MGRIIACCLAIVLAGSPLTASADSTQNKFAVFGEGWVTCGQWIEDRGAPMSLPRGADEAWIRGYLTGMNAGMSIFKPPMASVGLNSDPAANNLWIDNWCRTHPLSKINDAAFELYVALRHNSN